MPDAKDILNQLNPPETDTLVASRYRHHQKLATQILDALECEFETSFEIEMPTNMAPAKQFRAIKSKIQRYERSPLAQELLRVISCMENDFQSLKSA